MAETSRRWSPYNYVENDPIRLTDPDGMEATDCDPCDVPLFDRIVRPPSDGDRLGHPTKSAIQDADRAILGFLGVDDLINAIGDLGNKKVSIPGKAINVAHAVLNLATIEGEGEREPNIGKGTANPKILEAIKNGNAEHADFTAKANAKGWKTNVTMVDPKTGKTVRADAVTPSGKPVELKPNTPSGQKKGAGQLPKYERATGNKGRVVYYKPKTTK